jgi:alanyl-tRNA synthetase
MKTDELREKYLEFFEGKGHVRRPSDVLVPTWDPSVLFTPAGMNQFKDHFLGKVKLDFTRATTSQKCLRTGDIENVGRTAYHHTFFEMLGNFSFGDYFKREAIVWAWEFLTDKKWLGLDPDCLSVTVYLDDDEAATIWNETVGLPSQRIERMGEEDNFWPASAPTLGPDGVCGPCSEIFVHDGRGGSVEIWNLVFTQFQRVGDPPDNLRSLPSKNIDTGMGLERAAAVLQNVNTNFHIDILRPLVEAAAEICGIAYEPDAESGRRLRRIADHIRACTFAIHENVYPGPHKEKYVIRRLLRRAVLDGHQLGRQEPFLHQLAPVVAQLMRNPYPELGETTERVAQAIQSEETSFLATIDDALRRIQGVFGDMNGSGQSMVQGPIAAELYQTYGVPPELVESMAAEQGYTFDWPGFRRAMEEHGQKGRKGPGELFKTGPIEQLKSVLRFTEFVGYETTESPALIKGIVQEDRELERCNQTGPKHPITVVLDRTPFYAESGGQVGDMGEIVHSSGRMVVTDTQRDGDLILHHGYVAEGELRNGSKVDARVDIERREGIQRAHSATHLLHYALRKELGNHAQQQGSKVDRDWLRFDFSNLSPVGSDELERIEQVVNEQIGAAAPIHWATLPLREAREAGAMMLFGEKYPDPVRMVTMGDFSRELCGGTHLSNTERVQRFDLVSEEGVAAGTRRIVALTGERAAENARQTQAALERIAELLKCPLSACLTETMQLVQEVRDRKKQLTSGTGGPANPPAAKSPRPSERTMSPGEVKHVLRDIARLLNVPMLEADDRVAMLLEERSRLDQQLAGISSSGILSDEVLLEKATQVGDAQVVIAETPGAHPNLMRNLIDQLRRKSPPIAVLLASTTDDGKVILVAGVSSDLLSRGAHAGHWVRDVAQALDGGGGGKPDMAQAGGKSPEKLPAALEVALHSISKTLSA